MKKVIVLLPPKYGMTEEEASAYMSRREKLCHKAELMLDEYCEVSYLSAYRLSEADDSSAYLKEEFLRDNLVQLLDSDYAVFGAGCEASDECRLIRQVAEGYGVPILEVEAESEAVAQENLPE